jgi:hypothetical protein
VFTPFCVCSDYVRANAAAYVKAFTVGVRFQISYRRQHPGAGNAARPPPDVAVGMKPSRQVGFIQAANEPRATKAIPRTAVASHL